MFTPLFIRRLIFLVGGVCFGAASQLPFRAGLVLAMLSFICTVAEHAIGDVFGEAAQPLIPRFKLLALPRFELPALPKGTRALLLGLVALGVFLLLPWAVRQFYPAFQAFGPDTINAYTLGACQFFTALTMSYAAWRLLFPDLYAYAADTMECKILESITSDLVKLIPAEHNYKHFEALSSLAERRKIATLTFIVRCTRFALSVSPFVFFFVQANHALASALTAVPSAAPGL